MDDVPQTDPWLNLVGGLFSCSLDRSRVGGMWPTMEEWRSTIPGLVDHYVEQWSLTLGESYSGGSASHVVRARTADGVDAVLKLSLPHREARDESAALRWWDGHGAIRVLAHDPADAYATLLERCVPGTRLTDREDLPATQRLALAAELLAKLWQRGAPENSPFESVRAVCQEWADLLEQRMQDLRPPFDPGLVAHGAQLLRDLPASAGREVIVHGDFNPGNVLEATREPWLVIDPKPMLGDPGYDLCPLLMQVDDPFGHDDPGAVLTGRVDALADITSEPVDRILAWSVARLVEAGLWYVSRGELPEGTESMRHATAIANLLG
jgi:streptomycin 6-kinase